MDHGHGLLNGLAEKLEYCENRPAFLNLGNRWMSVLTIIEYSREQNQAWSPWTLGSVRKIKIISFIFGLIVTVLIMASYILTRDQKGLFLTPSPYHLTVISHPAQLTLNLNITTDYTAVREIVRSIVARVDFRRRIVPELRELREKETQVRAFQLYCSFF